MSKLHKVANDFAVKLAATELNHAMVWRKTLEKNLDQVAGNKIPPYTIPIADRQSAERLKKWVQWVEPMMDAYQDALYYKETKNLSVVFNNTMKSLQKLTQAAERERSYLHPNFFEPQVMNYIRGLIGEVQKAYSQVQREEGTVPETAERKWVAGLLKTVASRIRKVLMVQGPKAANSFLPAMKERWSKWPPDDGENLPDSIVQPMIKLAHTLENISRHLESKKPVNGPALNSFLGSQSAMFGGFPWNLVKESGKWAADINKAAHAVRDMR